MQGTPLPFEEDHQEGDVDDDDAVEEPELMLHTVCLFQAIQEAAIGR